MRIRLLRSPQWPSMLGALAALAVPADAATPFDTIAASSDVTVDLMGTTAHDEDVSEDDFVAAPVLIGPVGIPAGADLAAYHQIGPDDLFTTDITVALPGGITAGPSDVVRWDGAVFRLELDGAALGIPNGARVDAVSRDLVTGDLLLSFDVSIDFVGFTADDEDVVGFDVGGAAFYHFFDASAAGVPQALDLDALHHFDANGNVAVSFDTSGELAGIPFDDEDVLEYDLVTGSWELAFDGSAEHADWEPADLDAVHLPEPRGGWAGLAGAATVVAIGRRRIRRTGR